MPAALLPDCFGHVTQPSPHMQLTLHNAHICIPPVCAFCHNGLFRSYLDLIRGCRPGQAIGSACLQVFLRYSSWHSLGTCNIVLLCVIFLDTWTYSLIRIHLSGEAFSALSCWTCTLQFSHHATAMGGGWLSW